MVTRYAMPRSLEKIFAQRRLNLQKLIVHFGRLDALAHRLGYSYTGFLSQMASENMRVGFKRDMSERTARYIEERLKLPPLAMDRPLPIKLLEQRIPLAQ